MNINYKKMIRVYAFLLIAFSGFALAMAPDKKLASEQFDSIKATVERAKEVVKNTKANGSVDYKKILSDYAYAQVLALRKDNEPLWYKDLLKFQDDHNQEPFRIGIGFFRSDVVRAATFVGQCAADLYLCRKVRSYRIEYIKNDIIEQSDQWETLLTQVCADLQKIETEYEQASFIGKIFSSKQSAINKAHAPLIEHIKKYHQYIQYNPFKFDLIPAITGICATEKMCEWAESAFLCKPKFPDSYFTYERNEKGELQQSKACIFSVVTFARMLLSPRGAASVLDQPIRQVMAGGGAKLLNGLLGAIIPNKTAAKAAQGWITFWQSRAGQAFYHLAILGWSSSMMDAMFDVQWQEFIKQHAVRLRDLVRDYRLAQMEGNVGKVIDIETQIEQFVREAHQETSYWREALPLLCAWKSSFAGAWSRVQWLYSLPIFAATAWGLYATYKNITAVK